MVAPHGVFPEAFCWTVVTSNDRTPVDLAAVVRRLGGDPADLVDRDPADADAYADDDRCLWFVRQVGSAVVLLEVNNFQGSRPEVLRRLSSDGHVVHSAFWNIEHDNDLNHAVDGTVVTSFDGEFAEQRYGSEPDALETDRVPLWAAAGEDGWQAAMLALVEIRTGVALDETWFDRPQPSVPADSLPDDPPPWSPEGEFIERMNADAGPLRRAVLAWLAQRLVDEFQLRDEAPVARGIAALRAGADADEETQRQVGALAGRLSYDGPVDDRMPNDPAWRLFQAGLALMQALCRAPWDDEFPDMVLTHARNALGDAWPGVLEHLRNMR
jgi:hypothetical protein